MRNQCSISPEYPGIRYAEKKAKEEGKLEEKLEIAKSLKDEGLSIELISKTTGLPIEEIEKL